MIFIKKQSLKSYNTFGLTYYAENFAEFNSKNELCEILHNNEDPLLILGGGSNILLTTNFKGTVLKNNILGIKKINDTNENVIVKVGAGVVWHDFVLWCIKNNLSGVENLSLIPGSVGAAPMQNIGAYGVEIKSVFEKLDAINIANKTEKSFNNNECNFKYRSSIFKEELKGKYIITHVYFKLSKKHLYNISYGDIQDELEKMEVKKLSLKSISDAIINIRSNKLPNPNKIGNSGSFFKNPIINQKKFDNLKRYYPDIIGYKTSKDKMKIAAGWMIEKAGYKGYRKGDAGVYNKQALVLINHGSASGQEILNLAKEIQNKIYIKFKIKLEPEVNII